MITIQKRADLALVDSADNNSAAYQRIYMERAMSLADEIRVGQTPDQRATAETYSRHNDSARDEIARLTAEFERKSQVNFVPMGATALKLDIPQSVRRSIDRSHGKGAKAGGSAVKLKSKLKEVKRQWKDGI